MCLGAVDHHETLLSIKGVCSPKYIKTQMNVKYTLARFLKQNPPRVWTLGVAMDPQNRLQYQTMMGVENLHPIQYCFFLS